MKQNTILLILFGVILIYYLCKSSREGVEDRPDLPQEENSPENVLTAVEEANQNDPEKISKDDPTAGGSGPAGGPRYPGKMNPPIQTPKDTKIELGPELLDKIKELEETITKLKFQTKRAKLQGQNIVAVDKLDMGKLSMDLFNWQKLNKKSNVDVNLILGDHIKNSAKETSVKHIIANPKKEKSCDPVADEKEQEPPVKYKGYPVFTKPEFPRTQKYELPEGAQAGDTMKKPLEKADVNTGKPRPYNTESYDQKADTGIEKSH